MIRKQQLIKVTSFQDAIDVIESGKSSKGLSFYDFEFKESELLELCDHLKSAECQLQGIEFHMNNGIDQLAAEKVIDCLRYNSSLRFLSFGRNMLPDAVVESVIKVLQTENKTLTQFVVMYFFALAQDLKSQVTFLTERNSILSESLVWQAPFWKLLERKPYATKLILEAFRIHQVSIETHKDELINLFSQQYKKKKRDLNGKTVKYLILNTPSTNTVIAFAEICILMKTIGIFTEKEAKQMRGKKSGLFTVVLQQRDVKEADVEEAFLQLCEHFKPCFLFEGTNFLQAPGVHAVVSAVRTGRISPFLGSRLVCFMANEESILFPKNDRNLQNEVEQLFLAVLSAGKSNKRSKGGLEHDRTLASVRLLLGLEMPFSNVQKLNQVLRNSFKHTQPEVIAEIVKMLWKRDVVLADLSDSKKQSIFIRFLDSSLRGKSFYSAFRSFCESGYSLDKSNSDGRSILQYVLHGPPPVTFSNYGRKTNVSPPEVSKAARLKSVHQQFTGMFLERTKLNMRTSARASVLSAGSLMSQLANVLVQGDSLRSKGEVSERRASRVCVNFKEYRDLIEEKLQLRSALEESYLDGSEPTVEEVKFDCRGYISMLSFLLEQGELEDLNFNINGNINALETIVLRCQEGDDHLFSSIKYLFDNGFQVSRIKKLPNGDMDLGRYLLGLVVGSKGLSGKCFEDLLGWINEKGIYFDGMTLDGLSVFDYLLDKQAILRHSQLMDILRMLFSPAFSHFPLFSAGSEESLVDWVCRRKRIPKGITRPVAEIAELLELIHQTKQVDMNKLLIDGATIFEVILNAASSFRHPNEDAVYDALEKIFQLGYLCSTQNSHGKEALALLLDCAETGRVKPKFVLRVYQLIIQHGGEVKQSTHFNAALWRTLSTTVNNTTFDIIEKLISLGFEFCKETTLELLLQGNRKKCSLAVLVSILQSFAHLDLDFKALEKEFLEILFSFQRQEEDIAFVSALDACCGDESPVGLDVDSVDKDGRVFRQRLENADSAVVRRWAKRQKAYDSRYRKDEGAPVHKSETCEVVFAIDVHSQAKVALKIMEQLESFNSERMVRQELERFNEPMFKRYVLEVLASKSLEEEHYLVLPRADRSLFDVMNTERFTGRDIGKILHVARQAASALRFLKRAGFVHGDFKPRNIMRVDFNESKWKLIDLDCTREIGKLFGNKGSTGYSPPEMGRSRFLTGNRLKAAESFDVWSFGVVLFELVTGTPLFLRDQTDDGLFSPQSRMKLMNWISLESNFQERFILPHGEQNAYLAQRKFAAFDLLKKCLVAEKDNRIGFDEIMKHPFMKVDDKKFDLKVRKLRKVLNGRGNRDSQLNLVAEKEASLENHLFLSYVQKEGSEIVRTIYYGLSHIGCSSWLDMRAKRITEVGMLKGVLSSRAYLMVLTTNTLFRPFCVKELLWAIHHYKPVIFVSENDGRFHKFNVRNFFLKWQGQIESEQNFDTLLNQIGDLEGFSRYGKLNMEVALQTENPAEFILKNDFTAFLRKHLKEEFIIPYRRREFENRAMLSEILRRAGYVTLNDIDSIDNEPVKVTIPPNFRLIYFEPPVTSDAEFCDDILEGLHESFSFTANQIVRVRPISGRSYSIELNKVLEEVEDEQVVIFGILSLMTPGFFQHHKASLQRLFGNIFEKEGMIDENRRNLKNSIIAVQRQWFTQPYEQQTIEKSNVDRRIADLFVMHCEVLTWRPPFPRPYENIAMKEEITLRINEQLDRVMTERQKLERSRRYGSGSQADSSRRSGWVEL